MSAWTSYERARRKRSADCPACGDRFMVRGDGTIRRHYAPTAERRECPGSLHPPKGSVHVHSCRCGARWDEDA